MSYLDAVTGFYEDVARDPTIGLCCVGGADLTFPDLHVPTAMEETSYGCGSSVHPQDLAGRPSVLYIGIGGGKEVLQLAYFSRKPGGVIGVEPVAAMRELAQRNLHEAASQNEWFDSSFVEIRHGDALSLPASDRTVDVVAQNCLFNVFEPEHLAVALREARRVLRDGGKLCMSDPITTVPLPPEVRDDHRLRAMCLGGALTYDDYLAIVTGAGFGQVEIRRRRPYRVLDVATYGLSEPILLESIDLVAVATPIPSDGPCVFTGRSATYVGKQARLDDGEGHVFERGIPVGICDKTARALAPYPEIVLTGPTWHYNGGGCC
jgi:SAM-dependent methyltransferase